MTEDNAHAISELLRNMHPEVRSALASSRTGRENGIEAAIREIQEHLGGEPFPGKVPFPSPAAQIVLVERARGHELVGTSEGRDAALLGMLRSRDSVRSAEKEVKARSAAASLAAREPAALGR